MSETGTTDDDLTIEQARLKLGATKSEIERWVEVGRLPIARYKSFYKWGRYLQMRLFENSTVEALAPLVSTWRSEDQSNLKAKKEASARKAAATRKANIASGVKTAPVRRSLDPNGKAARTRREKFAAELSSRIGHEVRAFHRTQISYRSRREIFDRYSLEATIRVDLQPCFLDESVANEEKQHYFAVEIGLAECEKIAEAVLASRSDKLIAEAAEESARTMREALAALDTIAATWVGELSQTLSGFDASVRDELIGAILDEHEGLFALMPISSEMSRESIVQIGLNSMRVFEEALQRRLLDIRVAVFRDTNNYDRYQSLFPRARMLGRQIVFLCGPTNSGKTHEALSIAVAARSAEILSPLRLLALEHYEALRGYDVAAGMVTGEEEIEVDRATHVARTIETLDLNRVVDVCVIDEIQMIADRSRGWAWARALVGAPAKTLVLTGSSDALPVVEGLASIMGEPLTVKHLTRKTPLQIDPQPVSLNNLRKGDAVIAFSRRDVHSLREEISNHGRRVACIYGALGPEVRRAEAERFRSGDAEILIATDAIGMGLNLPIQRVLFSTLFKFDGQQRRGLTSSEIRQIAGRAGRHGQSERGLVGVLTNAPTGLREIEKALAGHSAKLALPVPVSPDLATVQAASQTLGIDSLRKILVFLRQNLVGASDDFVVADLSEVLDVANRIDATNLPLATRFAYAMAPVDKALPSAIKNFAQQHAKSGVVPWQEKVLNLIQQEIVSKPKRRFSNCRFDDDDFYDDYEDYFEEPSRVRLPQLDILERQSRLITLWLWLSRRFPDVYINREAALRARDRVADKIENELTRLCRDSVAKAQKRAEKKARKRAAKKARKAKERLERESRAQTVETCAIVTDTVTRCESSVS